MAKPNTHPRELRERAVRMVAEIGEPGAIRRVAERGPWRRFEDVEIATLEWIDWWNRRRLHSSIGDVPPAEFEAAHAARRPENDLVPTS